jgi:hypothetical protein
MMLRHAAFFAAILTLTACGDSVDLVSPDKVSGFKPGTTNQTEIVATLGKPIHTITEADGTKIDQYPYEGGAISGGGSIIPSFLGGDDTPSKYGMISFFYGGGGVLKDVKTGN